MALTKATPDVVDIPNVSIAIKNDATVGSVGESLATHTTSLTGKAALATAQTFTAAQRGAVTVLIDGATVTPDFNVANNFDLTVAGNRTLANPTNQTAGQSGYIRIIQDAVGGRSVVFGSNWKFEGGVAPTLSTTANAIDMLVYVVESASRITAKLLKDIK